MAAESHIGLPYKYTNCSCSHCQNERAMSFEEYTDLQNAAAEQAEEDFLQNEENLGVWAKRQEHIDSIVDPELQQKEQQEREEAERRAQRIAELREALKGKTLPIPSLQERPAFEVQNSAGEILISLSGEDLALLVRHLFWQAKQWQASEGIGKGVPRGLSDEPDRATVRNGLGEVVSEPCACGEPGCSARIVRDVRSGGSESDNG
jgi:hypothetical protein